MILIGRTPFINIIVVVMMMAVFAFISSTYAQNTTSSTTDESIENTIPSLDSIINQLNDVPQNSPHAIIDPNFLLGDQKQYEDHPKVSVRILDKITAESRVFNLDIGKTVAYGSLRIRPMTCKKTPPIEEPESAAFIQIWEKIKEGTDEWVFSGWMFASSPSLSGMDHPVYDLWVEGCMETDTNTDL